jgi:hypothetical protein
MDGGQILNLSDPNVRAMLVKHVDSLRGLKRVDIIDYRPRRSDRQNRFLHGVIVAQFGEHLRTTCDPAITNEAAKEFLKRRYLTRPLINRITGEEIGSITAKTSELSTAEMCGFLDNCIRFLTQECGLTVQDPLEWMRADEMAIAKGRRDRETEDELSLTAAE